MRIDQFTSFLCATHSVLDKGDLINDIFLNFQVLLRTKYGQKLCLSHKMRGPVPSKGYAEPLPPEKKPS